MLVNSWTNIHGIANYRDRKKRSYLNGLHGNGNGKVPGPIFGIDGHDVLSNDKKNKVLNFDDPRIIFTKSFRLIGNQVNNIRDTKHNLSPDVDKIIFYGHSLGHADYSYFESLFDLYTIYNSKCNTVLDFYYCKKSGYKEREERRKVLTAIVNLMTSYGQTLSGQHGENIVNRLVLEQRINLLPSPK